MHKPNFFIIGAPKCGTTSLASWLAEHPQIFMSPVKEPHFFNVDGMQSVRTLPEYEALFAEATHEHLAIGEASTHYLYSEAAIRNILEYSPNAKFLVSIRNPFEMAQALYAERVYQGMEPVRDFETAWRLQSIRAQGQKIPFVARKEPQRLQYGWLCKVGIHIERLFSLVPRDSVLVLVLDDIAQNPSAEYRKVLNFLGVPDDGRVEFPRYNERKFTRSVLVAKFLRIVLDWARSHLDISWRRRLGEFIHWRDFIKRWNTRGVSRGTLSPELKAELCEYFREDVRLLATLLRRDFSTWLE